MEADYFSFRELTRLKDELLKIPHVRRAKVIETNPDGRSVLEVFGLVNEMVLARLISEKRPNLKTEIPGPARVRFSKGR